MMKRLITAISLAALASSAFAGGNSGPRDPNTSERSMPDVPQTEESASIAPELAVREETKDAESAASGASTQPDGESTAAPEDSEPVREIDQ